MVNMVDIGMKMWRSWPELIGFVLLVIGFVVALAIESIWLSVIVMLLAGLMAGRLVYEKKGKQPLFPFFLIIILLLAGYLIGSFRVNRLLLFIIFVTSMILSYYIHKKKLIP